jgi:hypothetical protein
MPEYAVFFIIDVGFVADIITHINVMSNFSIEAMMKMR